MVYKICIEINSFKNKVLKLLNCCPKLFLKISFAILSALLLLSGCGKQQGSDRMRKELANIYAVGLENPEQYLHMNRKMVEWMKDKAQSLSPEKLIFHRYYLSQELLRAGQPEAAILELESILSDIGSKIDRVNNSTRPLIDELALAYLRLGEEINCCLLYTSPSPRD